MCKKAVEQSFEARIVMKSVEDTSAHDQILLAHAQARSDHGLNQILCMKDVFVWSFKKGRGLWM